MKTTRKTESMNQPSTVSIWTSHSPGEVKGMLRNFLGVKASRLSRKAVFNRFRIVVELTIGK